MVELWEVTGSVREKEGLQSVAFGNTVCVGFMTGGAPHRIWLQGRLNLVIIKSDTDSYCFIGEFCVLHADVVLSAVETVALFHREEPASDGGVLRYVEPLQSDVGIPAVL